VPRIKIEVPSQLPFSTEIVVRITDINYGGHLGNDALLSIVHESRVRYLASMGFAEHDVAGVGIIMTDAALVYRAEVFYGEVLRVDVGVGELTRAGAEIVYRLTSQATGKEVARAKTGIAFYDYSRKKVVEMPGQFRERVTQEGAHDAKPPVS
jgi:acyl-CoA thioester hydrolase